MGSHISIKPLPEQVDHSPLPFSSPGDSKMSFAGMKSSRFVRRPEVIKEKAVENILDAGFAYSRSLMTSPNARYKRLIVLSLSPVYRSLPGHTSCVNALAFSNGDGRFLASGGDGT